MRKRTAGVCLAILTLAVASGLSFAGTDGGSDREARSGSSAGQEKAIPSGQDSRGFCAADLSACLEFDAAMDDHVTLRLTNQGDKELQIGQQAYYMDELGAAGSLDCRADGSVPVKPGQTVYVSFFMDRAAAHGDNSILAFFFKYDNYWYLGKVGEKNGFEIFRRHS